ncbi:MAG: hypothetical protein ACK58M_05105 [Acidobacteriota bacterium]|jgi:hypothetical protein|nr:right-handed parallel beta-helix repeat-containing protein [Bryobacteraceae bacterium CoA2 C42]
MRLSLILCLLSAAGLAGAAEFFVSPFGSPGGNGSVASPWDLSTALAQPAAVLPGDTIWVGEGTYRGSFTSLLRGTAARPIVVRAAPAARAVIDGESDSLLPAVFTIRGAYAWIWGLEILNSHPRRTYPTPATGRPTGVDIFGTGVRLINCLVHDHGSGIGFWSNSVDSQLYGVIVYNNGWDGPDRGHGHAVYAQNEQGVKRITDSVFFNSFSHGIHIYGSEEASLNQFRVEGNIAFDNGALSRTGITRNILLGGGTVARDNLLADNYTYFSPSPLVGQNNIGYRAGCDGMAVRRNYFANGGLVAIECRNVVIEDNFFHPYIFGLPEAQLARNTYVRTRPTGTRVFVRPNEYEPGRAHLAVFNWDLRDRVPVDLSPFLRPGQVFAIRDLQNPLGPPVAGGVFDGRPVSLPLNLTTIATPVGEPGAQARHTPSEFGAFLLLPYASPVRRRGGENGSGRLPAIP